MVAVRYLVHEVCLGNFLVRSWHLVTIITGDQGAKYSHSAVTKVCSSSTSVTSMLTQSFYRISHKVVFFIYVGAH